MTKHHAPAPPAPTEAHLLKGVAAVIAVMAVVFIAVAFLLSPWVLLAWPFVAVLLIPFGWLDHRQAQRRREAEFARRWQKTYEANPEPVVMPQPDAPPWRPLTPDELAEIDAQPIDLFDLAADHRLIETIRGGGTPAGPIGSILASWRNQVDGRGNEADNR